MIYLIYGIDEYLIKNELKKITKNYDSIYDLNDDILKNVIEDANTIPMFSEKKHILVNNSTFLSVKSDIDTTKLEEYLDNPSPSTTLVFVYKSEKLDERRKLTKTFRKYTTVIECNKIEDINNFIKEQFKPYKINYQSISLLIERIGKDLLMLLSEIEKIKIYKDEDLEITYEDIQNVSFKMVDTNIFDLIDYIINDDVANSLKILEELKAEEPVKIITMIANQIRLMYQAKGLNKKGYTEKDMFSILGVHPYRIKLALQKSYNYSSELLLSYLNKLADLDYLIKSGQTNKENAIEIFILNKKLKV